MIIWNKVTWYSQLLAVILSVVIFHIGFIVGERTTMPLIVKVPMQATSTISELTSPVPTELITFKGLEMTKKTLPPLPSPEEWNEILSGSGIFENRYREDVIRYGDIAKRYNSIKDDNNPYINVEVADVTGDGLPEQIISLSGGGSYGVDTYEIIAGDQIIATIDAHSVGSGAVLESSKNGDGFEIIWFNDGMFPDGFCCPVAQMITRFEYHNETFEAVSEKIEILKFSEE